MAGAALGASTANPIFSLNANQALVTAPAPPEPKPQPVVIYAPSGSVPPGAMDEKTKKLVMFGGIGAGAVILLLLGIVIFGGSKSSDDDTAKAAASATADAKSEPKEEKKEPPKAEEKPVEAAAAPSATEEKKPEEPAKTEPAKTDTSKGTGHAAVPATKKEEPAPAGPSTAPPFSKASAISALGSASSAAGGCKKPGGPTGVGKVQVTFAPSGRVTSATVMGPPFAGTAVGGCVAGKFRGAKVPAFSGNAVTVSKSFAIN
jgi:Sec-independent protein translocase protein TatA